MFPEVSSPFGVYHILNKINGKRYIGSTSSLGFRQRWINHVSELNTRKHGNIHLQRAWDKHGSSAFKFSVLEYCDPKDAISREQHYLDTCKPAYNICPVAGSLLGFKHTEESKERAAASHVGKKRSAEARANMSAWQIGRKKSPEFVEKMAASLRGRKHSPETIAKISASQIQRLSLRKEAAHG